MDSAGERFEAICAALADRNNILTVKDLCELAGVSRSGYKVWSSDNTEEWNLTEPEALYDFIVNECQE